MSYWSISQMQADAALRSRVIACCAQEGAADPTAAMNEIMWGCVSEPGWGEAWDYAVEAAKVAGPGNSTDPGIDPAVITDSMILSAVQKHLPAAEAT